MIEAMHIDARAGTAPRTRQRKHSGALWSRCSVLLVHLLPKVQFFARLWRRRGSTVRRGCSASAVPLGWGSSRAGRSSSASPLRCPGMSLSSLAGHLCARACVRACARARAYMRSSVCVGTDRQPTEHGPGEGGTTLQVLPSADWGWSASGRRRSFGSVRRILFEGDALGRSFRCRDEGHSRWMATGNDISDNYEHIHVYGQILAILGC